MWKVSSYSKYTPLAPLHPWLWPIQPWHRIHLDFAGPVRGKMLLVVFDAHSKWPEVFPMVSTTTLATGTIPRQFVSDNGPQFISDEFKQFLASNGVKHIKSSPYHPATNWAVHKNSISKELSRRVTIRIYTWHTWCPIVIHMVLQTPLFVISFSSIPSVPD